MRVLVAPDSFGGTLSAIEAAEAIRSGWLRAAPADHVDLRPLSDGGPGFVATLAASLPGRRLPVPTVDPLGRGVTAEILLAGDTAYVESAQACGLHLLAADERDPKRATSYGVGALIAAAVESGARRIVVGLGGSATNDGGAGMLAALGAVPLAPDGGALPYGGAALAAVDRIEGLPALRGAQLVAATDVDNPLTGLHGASAIFGPQKGASAADVSLLDAALAHFGAVLQRDAPAAPVGLADLPGTGAAGGLGVALLALGGIRESGIAVVRHAIRLDAAVGAADLTISGEGSFDFQSLRGKAVTGVAAAASEHGVPCVVLAGQVGVGRREAAAVGVDRAYSIAEHAGSIEAAMSDAAARLADLAAHVARQWHR
ncbi:MAG: glycerate kinase family protein [Mycobacteriales bacterium]